jgi:hypothetical protein
MSFEEVVAGIFHMPMLSESGRQRGDNLDAIDIDCAAFQVVYRD